MLGFSRREWLEATIGAVFLVAFGWVVLVVAIVMGTP